MRNVPTPLLIVQARNDDKITEVVRVRQELDDRLGDILTISIAIAALENNPDEIIIRLLRPQHE